MTGSRAAAVLAKIKSGEAAARRDYRTQLVAERLTGAAQESGYVNADMQRGIDLEPAALAAYEAHTGEIVRATGFLSMSEHMAGCSLDGDVDEFEGLVEVKCPKSATHIEYFKARRLPPEYVAQVTHNLWVTGAKWLDFCSYDDRVPDWLQFFQVRVYREELPLDSYEKEVLRFLAEVASEVIAVERLKGVHALGDVA